MAASRQKLIQEFFEALATMKRAISTGRSFPFDDCTLSKAQIDVLMFMVHQKKGVSVKDLASYLHVTSGAVTQLVDAMVEKNLVERTESESDRRIQILRLTQKTNDTFATFRKNYYRDLAPVFNNLSEHEIETLTGLMKKLDYSKLKGGENK